jgi:hypothetical protein
MIYKYSQGTLQTPTGGPTGTRARKVKVCAAFEAWGQWGVGGRRACAGVLAGGSGGSAFGPGTGTVELSANCMVVRRLRWRGTKPSSPRRARKGSSAVGHSLHPEIAHGVQNQYKRRQADTHVKSSSSSVV